MKRSVRLAIVLAIASILLWTRSASAHAFIDHCTPELGSTVAQAPKQVQCTYTAPVDVRQTVFGVYDAKKVQVDNKDLKSDPSDPVGKSVIITLNTAKVTPGIYTVKWQTTAEDGDQTDGQWQFSVGAATAPAVTIVEPAAEVNFAKVPSDVVVTVKVSNFQLGQAGRRWQVYLDDKLVTQVTNGSLTTTLKAVPKGDHELKITLATAADEKSVVTTSAVAFTVGAPPTPTPTVTPTITPTKPAPTATRVALAIPTTPRAQPTQVPNILSGLGGNNTFLYLALGGLVVLLLIAGAGVIAFFKFRKPVK